MNDGENRIVVGKPNGPNGVEPLTPNQCPRYAELGDRATCLGDSDGSECERYRGYIDASPTIVLIACDTLWDHTAPPLPSTGRDRQVG